MMQALEYLWLPLLVWGTALTLRTFARRRAARRAADPIIRPTIPAQWEALSSPKASNNNTIEIYVRRGGHKLPIGEVQIDIPEFGEKLLDLMAEAESKAGVMNSSVVKWDAAVPRKDEVAEFKEKYAAARDRAAMWEAKYEREKYMQQHGQYR